MPIVGFQSICTEKACEIISRDKGEKTKHIAYNLGPAHVSHYRVDGEIITMGNKCDFLLINEDKKVAYFIELKGSDLTHAAKQIEATQQTLKDELKEYFKQYRIVANKCKTQEIESAAFKRYRLKWRKQLSYKTGCLKEYI